MSIRQRTRVFDAKAGAGARAMEFIGEEPLLIRVEDKPYSVVMRTPGEEGFHAAGFCLGEGIVDGPDDFARIGYDESADPNVIDVWLEPDWTDEVHERLERRFFISQTSCGICGKELLADLHQILSPADRGFEITLDQARECIATLSRSQQHYQTTRGSHAALLFDEQLQVLAFAEDVGRHNALDKAIGKALLDGTLATARVLVMSSRLSYELVQKAARARLPIVFSESRPTGLAVDMGRALAMTLGFPDGDDLALVCGPARITA